MRQILGFGVSKLAFHGKKIVVKLLQGKRSLLVLIAICFLIVYFIELGICTACLEYIYDIIYIYR